MDVRRQVRDIVGAQYYRRRPLESLRLLDSRRRFRSGRTDVRTMVQRLGIDAGVLDELDEWRPQLAAMDDAITGAELDQGPLSRAGREVLYAVVRSLRPAVVIETGVAAGASTAYLAAALVQNGSGDLYSIDLPAFDSRVGDGSHYDWISRPVGWAIPAELREAIGDRLHLVLEDVRTSLPALLDRVGPVDLFFHDDLHTPDHMRWEYDLVWPRLSPGGVLASDDANHAWLHFTGAAAGGALVANVDRLVAVRKPPAAAVAS
ncbi:MAG: class I SAM-dependent methyltransferase [Acidimicrobiia bacterium]